MNKTTKAQIVRMKIKEILKPILPVAIQAMSEQQLLQLILTYPMECTYSDVLEAYEALRRIDMVKYPEINFDLEAAALPSDQSTHVWLAPPNSAATTSSSTPTENEPYRD